MASISESISNKLFPEQIANVGHMVNVLKDSYVIQNASPTGSGKTYVTCALAKHHGLPMIVIGPKSSQFTWVKVANEFDVDLTFHTYAALRGRADRKREQKPYGAIHKEILDLLVRTDTRTESNTGATTTNQVSYSPMQGYLTLVNQGVLLVIDECHHLKNASDQNFAVRALIQPLAKSGTLEPQTKSRAIFLSATPFDKDEHSVNMCRAMGLIHHRNLAAIDEWGIVTLYGLDELGKICQMLDETKTIDIFVKYDLNIKNYSKVVYELYVNVIKQKLVTSLPPPSFDYSFDVKNGFYKMAEMDRKKLVAGIENLAKAATYSKQNDAIGDFKSVNWGKINSAMLDIEKAKLHIFVRATSDFLEESNGNKVAIFVQFRSSVEFLSEMLQCYGVATFTGNLTSEERVSALESFQNKATDTRVFISTIGAGKESISLHDIHGAQPRLTLTVANYSPTDLHQISGRTNRKGRLSPATVRVVYGKDTYENKILNALARKSNVIKSTLDKVEGITLPGDYENWIED